VHQIYEVSAQEISRIKESVCDASTSFLYKPCLGPSSDSEVRTSIDIGGRYGILV